MKDPNPDKLVVIDGMPICSRQSKPIMDNHMDIRTTVHSAGVYPHGS